MTHAPRAATVSDKLAIRGQLREPPFELRQWDVRMVRRWLIGTYLRGLFILIRTDDPARLLASWSAARLPRHRVWVLLAASALKVGPIHVDPGYDASSGDVNCGVGSLRGRISTCRFDIG